MTTLGQVIKSVRKSLGKSQLEFAHLLGCSRNTVSRYELDELSPSRSMLLLILQHAQGATERSFLHDLLGTSDWEVEGLEEVKGMVSEVEAAAKEQRVTTRKQTVMEFADLALQILRKPEPPIIPAVNSILRAWLAWRDEAIFEKLAGYLDIELKPIERAVAKARAEQSTRFRNPDIGPFELWTRCPNTKKMFFTGSTAESEEAWKRTKLDHRIQSSCPHCRASVHDWGKDDVVLRRPRNRSAGRPH